MVALDAKAVAKRLAHIIVALNLMQRLSGMSLMWLLLQQ
jgi:hypothetical protein